MKMSLATACAKAIRRLDKDLENRVRSAFDDYVTDKDNADAEVELLLSLYKVKQYSKVSYVPLYYLYKEIRDNDSEVYK